MEKAKNLILKGFAFFYQDFQWKLLAFGLAFILWFVGINVNDPLQIINYNQVPLNVLHKEQLAQNDVVLLNENQINSTQVSVSISATRSNHALIQAARNDNIQASIDLSTINFDQVHDADSAIRIPLDVDVFIHQDHVSRTMRPSSVELALDRHVNVSKVIEVDPIGTPLEGYENKPYQLDRTMVRISGARSVLDQVSDVRARVYVDDAFETVNEVASLVVYNRERQDITSAVTLSFSTVHVQIPIYPYKRIPLIAQPVGATMSEFLVTSMSVDPAAIVVVGEADILAETTHLVIGEVDVSGVNADVEKVFSIGNALEGTGLTLRADFPTEARATAVVEQVISRSFDLPVDNIAVRGETRPYSFVTEGDVTFTVRGRESVITALELDRIRTHVDLTGLGAGIHLVRVHFDLPNAAALSNLVTVEVALEPEPITFEPEEPADWTADSPSDVTDEDIEIEEDEMEQNEIEQTEGDDEDYDEDYEVEEEVEDHLTEVPQGSTS